jgi:hypothetical protein
MSQFSKNSAYYLGGFRLTSRAGSVMNEGKGTMEH